MRLMVKLKAIKSFGYDIKYYHKLQGFIYNLLQGTEYSVLHDKKGYKFFCFSNIFPLNEKNGILLPIRDGETKSLLLSSPDKVIIQFLERELNKLKDNHKAINIGEMQFTIENVSLVEARLRNGCRVISATPITIRIPEYNYDTYAIPAEFRKKRYVYWRAQIDFNAFLRQLEENLFKKYNEFHKTEREPFSVFEQFVYKKPVVSHVIIDGREQKLIGSIWEFIFSYLSKEQKEILEFGLDCGFGERNSLGFGFVNIVR